MGGRKRNIESIDLESVWNNIKDKLHNYEYWTSNAPNTWDVNGYDKKLLDVSYNSKRMAHQKLKSDISIILATFTHEQEIKRGASRLRRDLTTANEENQMFWSTSAVTTNKNKQALDSAAANLQASSMNTTARLLDLLFRDEPYLDPVPPQQEALLSAQTLPQHQLPTQQHRYKKHKNLSSSPLPVPIPSSSSLSSSAPPSPVPSSSSSTLASNASPSTLLPSTPPITLVKKRAEELLNQYNNNKPLLSFERKIMTNGLSSIIDFADDDALSESIISKPAEWKTAKEQYETRYPIPMIDLHPDIIIHWDIICATAKMSRSIDASLKYLYRLFPKYFDNKDVFIPFKLMESLLLTVSSHPQMLQKQKKIDFTEYDYFTTIWQPMFNILFEKSNIRMKTHESTFFYSTEAKKEQYHDSKNVIGFKVDVQLLIDHDGKEYDLCSGELAKEDDHDKIILDKAKLNRESKDDLDCILDICKEDEWTECKAWQFQAVGGSANLNSIHLVGNGSYAVIARYRMTMPASIGDFSKFIITIKQLLTWRKDIYETADMVTKRLATRPKLSRPQDSNIYSAHTSLQRDTTYTPPEGSRWKKPTNLYGYVPVNIQEKLLAAYHSSGSSSSSSSTPSSLSTPQAKEYDAFGWVWTGANWHNKVTDVYRTSHPYEEDQEEHHV